MTDMALRIGRQRIALGGGLRLVECRDRELWLEGGLRLRPGQVVALAGHWPAGITGEARVTSWRLVSVGRAGPVYRGCCQLVA